MIHWMAYAELRFGDSAHLALARAVEESASEALTSLPDAWLIEDRKITLHVEADTPRAEMMAVKQLLTALLRTAEHGEAVIEVPPFDRWSRPAAGGRASSPMLSLDDWAGPDSEDRATVPLAGDTGKDGEALGSDREPDVFR